MLVDTLILKVKERLNKIDSNDFDNIENHYILEAFNKAQLEWVRKTLHGNNIYKEGDEQSKRRIEDLNVLLKTVDYPFSKHDIYVESNILPTDYLYFKSCYINAKKDCCKKNMIVYLAENENIGILLRDYNKKPSFEWGETFCTLLANRVRVYTNGEFDVSNLFITYYQKPVIVEKAGVFNVYSNAVSGVDVQPIFRDDVTEVIIDVAVSILAGDIENIIQYQRANTSSEQNN